MGYVQTVPGGYYPGYYPGKNFCKFCSAFIPVPETSRSSVRHSYLYPKLLEVLCARGHKTRGVGTARFVPARNFCEFCTPVPQYPEVLEILQDIRTRTGNFWKFCRTLIPLPGNSVTPVRPWHNTRGTGIPSLQYPGSSVSIQV